MSRTKKPNPNTTARRCIVCGTAFRPATSPSRQKICGADCRKTRARAKGTEWASKKWHGDPEHRKRVAAARIERFVTDPAKRSRKNAANAEYARRRWANPEFREAEKARRREWYAANHNVRERMKAANAAYRKRRVEAAPQYRTTEYRRRVRKLAEIAAARTVASIQEDLKCRQP
jgi:hypothetical protein